MSSYVIPLIIHGEDVTLSEDGSKTTFEANPDLGTRFPGRPLWTTQEATPELAIRAVKSCSEAFQSWSKTPLTKRRALFLNLAQVSLIMEEKSKITPPKYGDGWLTALNRFFA